MENIIDEYSEIVEYFGDDSFEYTDSFENYRKTIITTVAYLIGVSDEFFTMEDRFDIDEYEKLNTNEAATTIKYLCRLRTQFLRNYKYIDDARKYDFRPLETLSDLLDVEGIKYLYDQGIVVNVPNSKTPSTNIAYINQYILDNIDKVKPLIPDWIKFQYIKSLFLMSGGYAGHRGANLKSNDKKIYKVIFEAGKAYGSNRNSYPYQMYISWPHSFRDSDGNILYNDLKFLKMLYAAHGDRFHASRYVVDAISDTKEDIYVFLVDAVNAAIFVDCENVDPYSFAATLLNLDNEILSKIKKIVLYDDINTSTAWDYIADVIDIPVIKKDIERVLDNKSLVDITMAVGVCEEFYRYDMDSIILASSDSDFWGLIKQLPEARFLVLNEYKKTSGAIIEQLDKYDIQHCYMNDFAQDRIQRFKSDVLFIGLMERIKSFNETGTFDNLNVTELLQQLFYDAYIFGAESQVEKEKEAFYNKYLKNGLLLKPVTVNGELRLQIELHKK